MHVIYDDTDTIGRLTKRLIILLKKAMRLLGDEPMRLAIDGSQFFDIVSQEDYGTNLIESEMGLDWTLIERFDTNVRNHFCVLIGKSSSVVIGAYPPLSDKPFVRVLHGGEV